MLQETHFKEGAAPQLHDRSYPSNYFCSHQTARKSGVAIVIAADLELQELDQVQDTQGHFLFLKGLIADEIYTLATMSPTDAKLHSSKKKKAATQEIAELHKSISKLEQQHKRSHLNAIYGELMEARRTLRDLILKKHLRSLQHSKGFYYAHANKGGKHLAHLLKGTVPCIQIRKLRIGHHLPLATGDSGGVQELLPGPL
ncbi:Hypothetical predicted protein [Pelobates cultripes]|uniref:Uncharacterized protein n=1 Tax=Pelobates cultripes TaxID=61616 RepID=A0AAD1SLJ3_PELCU|nr:Hypothetical predicted protein [Pelobates cultripes]